MLFAACHLSDGTRHFLRVTVNLLIIALLFFIIVLYYLCIDLF